MARRPSIPALLSAAVLAAGGLTGCSSAPKPVPASPDSRSQQSGLELTWWLVEELPQSDAAGLAPSLTQVLAEYEKHASPIPWRTLETWRACGMRVLSVPATELDALRSRLHITAPLQQQWLGEVPRWTQAAQAAVAGGSTVRLDNGPLTLEPGTLRLLVRAWTAPARLVGPQAAGEPAVLQLEMVPQFVPRPDESFAAQLHRAEEVRPTREQEGVAFTRLSLQATLTGDDALIIVPEAPEIAWTAPEPKEDAAEAPPSLLGPPVPATPTLGEVLLSGRDSPEQRRTRMILVLTPAVPPEYRLFGQAR